MSTGTASDKASQLPLQIYRGSDILMLRHPSTEVLDAMKIAPDNAAGKARSAVLEREILRNDDSRHPEQVHLGEVQPYHRSIHFSTKAKLYNNYNFQLLNSAMLLT